MYKNFFKALIVIIVIWPVIIFAHTVLATDGAIDPTFVMGTGFDGGVQVIQKEIVSGVSKMIVAGTFTSYNGTTGLGNVVRLNDNGTVDPTFVTGTGFNGAVTNSDILQNGNIVFTGNFTTYNGVAAPHIAVVDPSGGLVTSFMTKIGAGFTANTRGVLEEEVADADQGKILVGENNINTKIDNFSSNFLARLQPDGTPDGTTAGTFNYNIGATGFNNSVQRMSQQSTGKIITGGAFTSFNGHSAGRILRLNSDGTFDNSFNAPGSQTGAGFGNGTIYSIVVLPGGDMYVSGSFTSYNGFTTSAFTHLTSNGLLDTSFASVGTTSISGTTTNNGANGEVDAVYVQPNGSIILIGNFTSYTTSQGKTLANRIIRILPTGFVDPTFDSGGSTGGFNAQLFNGVHSSNSIVRANGSIVVGGNFITYNGVSAPHIVSLYTDITNPVFSNITLTSSNTNHSYAKLGDTITLSFTSDHPLTSSTITLAGSSVVPTCNSATGTSVVCSASVVVDAGSVPHVDGLVSFSISGTSVGGTTGPVTTTTDSSSVTVLRTTPATPTINSIASPTNNSTPAISGTCTSGDTVTILIGSAQTLTATCSGSVYTVTPTTLADGSYTISATQSDGAGNTSGSITTPLVIDTTAPSITITVPPQPAFYGDKTIVGTCESGLIVSITGSGFTPSGTTTCNGSFRFDIIINSNVIITATQTDNAGNIGTSTISISAIKPSPATVSGGCSFSIPAGLPGGCTEKTPLINTQPAVFKDSCVSYITKKITRGEKNDSREVNKLMSFLNSHEHESLVLDGVYGKQGVYAVMRFQKKYLTNIGNIDGVVGKRTRAQINKLFCSK